MSDRFRYPATLLGDVRDSILDELRAATGGRPWRDLREDEQEATVRRVERQSEALIRGVVSMVAAKDFPIVEITIGDTTAKQKSIKFIGLAEKTEENLLALGVCEGPALLVRADSYSFLNAPLAKIERDQRELALRHPEQEQDEQDEAAAGDVRGEDLGSDVGALPGGDGDPGDEQHEGLAADGEHPLEQGRDVPAEYPGAQASDGPSFGDDDGSGWLEGAADRVNAREPGEIDRLAASYAPQQQDSEELPDEPAKPFSKVLRDMGDAGIPPFETVDVAPQSMARPRPGRPRNSTKVGGRMRV